MASKHPIPADEPPSAKRLRSNMQSLDKDAAFSAPTTTVSSPIDMNERGRTRSLGELLPPSEADKFAPVLDRIPEMDSYLPFNFGVEFEVILKPLDLDTLRPGLSLPDADADLRSFRDFSEEMRPIVAEVLSGAGFEVDCPEGNEITSYERWNIVFDSSVSIEHRKFGFYPLEIVSPILKGDEEWSRTIDKLWTVLTKHFEFRQDATCGTHVHISLLPGTFRDREVRLMAKTILVYGLATMDFVPPSRNGPMSDRFLRLNLSKTSPAFDLLVKFGPLDRIKRGCEMIDGMSRDEICEFICEDRFRIWNFRPAMTGKAGPIEFRGAPGVVCSRKAKHWIAFVMAFVDFALHGRSEILGELLSGAADKSKIQVPNLGAMIEISGTRLGITEYLDKPLKQEDDIPKFWLPDLVLRSRTCMKHLRAFSLDYGKHQE